MERGGYWHPDWIPSFPYFIDIGNNVTVSADVRIYEHDMIQRMWDHDPTFKGEQMKVKADYISIGDNSVLGGQKHSIVWCSYRQKCGCCFRKCCYKGCT